MAQVRANQMQAGSVYVMRTFRRKGGSNYQYDLVRFISRTSDAKLNELQNTDQYHVIIGETPVTLIPVNGVLARELDGRSFRVTFQTEDTAVALGLTATPRDMETVIEDDSVIPVEPVEPVLPPEPVEPVEPVQKATKVRKPLTAEQKARKNEMARARRAAQKAV